MKDPRTGRPCSSTITVPPRRLLSDAEINTIADDARRQKPEEAARHLFPLIQHIGLMEQQHAALLAAVEVLFPPEQWEWITAVKTPYVVIEIACMLAEAFALRDAIAAAKENRP